MKTRMIACLSIVVLALCVPTAGAQEKDPRLAQPAKPLPPVTSGESSSKAPADSAAAPESQPGQADQRPLSGVQDLGLGGGGRSMLLPSLQFLQSVDTNRNSTGTANNLEALSTLRGQLALQKIWSNHTMTLGYSGGGSIYDHNAPTNGQFHMLGITENFALRRWNLLFSDQFNYSPDTSFGGGNLFSGIGGQNLAGSGFGSGIGGFGGINGGGLNPAYVPGQTIFSSRGARLNNSVVGQAQYSFSGRSSWTGSGGYSVLHFLDSGFIDSKNANFSTGYNYQLSGKNTVAVTYGLSRVRFGSSNGSVNNNNVQISFARRVTGRLAFQVGGGPQINLFDDPINGKSTRLSWGTRTSLVYRLPRTTFDLSYNRRITGGSGVLLGAQTDFFRFGANRQFSRNWIGMAGLGYSHNSSLRALTTGTTDRHFNSVQADVSVHRPLGHYASLYLLYNAQWQNSVVSPCAGAGCNSRFLRHHFGIGLDWQFRPINLD